MTRTPPLLLALLLPALAAADNPPPTTLTKPKMGFEDAARPYQKLAYDYGGYVRPDGKVEGKGLGCSAFTSAVLHRMRDGDDWLERYDRQVYQWYGDRAAKHFGLPLAGTFPPEKLTDTKGVKALVADKTLSPGALYYFNARKGKNGHVGFVRFAADGTAEQWHFSSISKGLFRGQFAEWVGQSMYRTDSQIELYRVPEPPAKP